MSDRKDDMVPVFVDALISLAQKMNADDRIRLFFLIFLGRAPQQSELEHYRPKFTGPREHALAAACEIAASREASWIGAMDRALANSLFDRATPLPPALCMLAVMGVTLRIVTEQSAKLAELETSAKITLLSVPEWCGQAFDRLEERVRLLEAGSASRSG